MTHPMIEDHGPGVTVAGIVDESDTVNWPPHGVH